MADRRSEDAGPPSTDPARVGEGAFRTAVESLCDAHGAVPRPAEPVAFGGLFGRFSPGTGGRGVILCGTLGYEQLVAHRAWRDLAGRIAAAGCPCLIPLLSERDSRG